MLSTENTSDRSRPPQTKSERLLWRWVSFSARHPGKIVIAFALLAAFAGLLATRIRIDANLESMLPQNSKTIQALKETRARFGSSDLFALSFVMKDPLEIAKVQDEIRKEMVEKWPDALTVQVDRDGSFFKTHALLYLPVPALQKFEDRLTAKRSELKLGPLGVDLLSDAPAPAQGPLLDANSTQQLGLPDEAADLFRKFIRAPKDSSLDSADMVDRKEGIPDSLKSRLIGKLDDGRYVGVVQAVLKKPNSDYAYAKTVFSRSLRIRRAYEKKYGSAIQIGVKGPYKSLNANAQSLSSNGTIATVVSVALTLLIVLAYFRAPGPIFLVLGQAAISCLFTLGFASLSYGRLNLYTIFVIAILFGMGTDFSLYVMGYAQRQFRRGLDWPTAIFRTLSDMSSSLVTAWITTVAGLLTLLCSRFAGFYEFGLIASIGMTFSLLLTYLFLPSAIFLVKAASHQKIFAWLRIEPSKVEPPATKEPSWLPRFAAASAAIVIIGSLALIPFASNTQFEYDFTKLGESEDSWSKTITGAIEKVVPFHAGHLSEPGEMSRKLPVNEALGTHRASSQPVVMMADSPEAIDEIHDTLQRRLTVEHDKQISSFLTLRSFVPAARDQAERLPHLQRIGAILSDKVFDMASGNDSQMIAMVRQMSRAKTFTAEDIPTWARDLLRERDGRYGRIGFIYSRFNTSDALEAQRFESRYNHFTTKKGGVTCYSSSFVYADLVRLVREDAVRMSLLMIAILCILLAVILRKLRPVLVCFIGMSISILWILGLMGLFHQKVNVFNLIVITTIQAALTDVVIYVVLAWERQNRRGLRELYTGIGSLMSVAIGTTIAGYAGMLFTSHLGIQSMGAFATISLSSCLVTSLCVTPWLCLKLLPQKTVNVKV